MVLNRPLRNRVLKMIQLRMDHVGNFGMCEPELLAKKGMNFGEAVWFKARSYIFSEGDLYYLGNSSLVHAQSILDIWYPHGSHRGIHSTRGIGERPYLPGSSIRPSAVGRVPDLKTGMPAMFSMFGFLV
ncbi:hypothetical protein MARPO_0079s0014 [Marchantia polymorpha]|uniref:Chlorophyll a-b binding protein, chloroplastic n=1 Tax=Marchantia polymorpha TaxID=3197 RepID=A0A2R6WKW4_MARPO|nr:hypothetical protein MARPO_0079s0014 [Marchantia polymorpha]|eukprot:PTQ34504.1 hypothetical protein MARPO_0079s0014 [Marchantia polymorpha]